MAIVSVVGATGLVGETMLRALEKSSLSIKKVIPVASERSLDRVVNFQHQNIPVVSIKQVNFDEVDVVLMAAGSSVAKEYAPIFVEAGCWVIDNSSFFRYEKQVPLVVPEINGEILKKHSSPCIIANPNCSTIQMCMVLKPIMDAFGIKRVVVSTYQSVSGVGRKGIQELVHQVGELLNGRPAVHKVFPKIIAFNVLPHIDEFQENGYTREEMKMVWESKKILNDDSISISPTAVRVPTLFGHSESINVETKKKTSIEELREVLKRMKGVKVVDSETRKYPTTMDDAVGHNAVYVGRIRADLTQPNTFNMWVVADNVRKGAATNAVQIAELLKEYQYI